MNREELHALLHPWFDGELDAARSLEFEKHLDDCPSCRQQIENQQSLRKALTAPELYYPADNALRRRISRNLKKAVRTESRMVSHWFSWNAAAAVVILAVGIVIGVLLRGVPSSTSSKALVNEAVAANVRSLMANHLTDVLSSDQHTVKPWFDGKLDFSPPVKDLAAQGFPLMGGRLDYLDGRPVAALVYKRRLHTINVFVWPAATPPSLPAGSGSHDGYNVIHWTATGMNFWVVSDLNTEELGEFVRLLQSPG
ncbi:MAG: anti-sigma factor [Gammaproteobacteria bacterium]|nr:anti-sigma factor [Gammaproteobacteria bacterium]MBU6510240.1 anti-sigma factor [Gammaproteobacteria bacterium]MDE1984587.1 anti-sigma factor [Gammaproteobacteria bacterium]MDE2462038.1 anti-sigma factor [Gammaproteobacteria bacterium]